MAYIQVRGHAHYYEWITAAGDATPSGKPVLVFIHGSGGIGSLLGEYRDRLNRPL
ncbi:hypothetical protein [Neosynechococcus sphagnicola]|uniref:hypothetical protein n=1 Tax=Neosynechococcus sphagnicola TaxID=1501145 RepID=UPI001EFA03CB|nr:hypothetical protein [Neosynechococcus sphagnicola]